MPDWSRTVHGVGDLHAGGIVRSRVQTMLDDVAQLPTPALHLQIGDATQSGTAAQDEMALRWLGRLPGRYETILGNHDIWHNNRTPGQWAKAYGYRSKNFTIHLPFLRIIAVGPDRDLAEERSGKLSKATLAFLDRELSGNRGFDCWVASHWPLYRTVRGGPGLYSSLTPSFHAQPDAQIRAVLARHRNAKAWLSGHTHSPLQAPGLVTRAPLPGRRSILAVNLSALVAVGKTKELSDPLCSLYLTHLPGKIEIRFRDHRKGAWIAPHRRQVVTVRV
jgi:calcineurin-like phosphoesterase family protein